MHVRSQHPARIGVRLTAPFARSGRATSGRASSASRDEAIGELRDDELRDRSGEVLRWYPALDDRRGARDRTQNQTRAARRLGLSRRALIYKMEKYGLKPPPSRADS